MATKFGRYELLGRISVGGMAEVFRGRVSGAAGFEKIVAIKRILPQLSDDEEFIGMFIDEAKLSANLNHSNIGQVFEFGRIDDRYFIAMEFIHGKDLRAIQAHFRSRGEVMPIPMAIRVVLEVCNALEYAHSKRDSNGQLLNIVHRDVSPQNVLISYEGAVKLIDFGIAKALSRSNKTATGNLKGKFDYMSPEQVEGEAVDHRSDLFALGTLLWELVAGRPLFRSDNELATLERVRKAQVEPPSSVNPSVPKALEKIVLRALAKQRDQRFQRAEEMHEELERFAQSHRMTFSTKQLSRWMKASFNPDGTAKSAPVQPRATLANTPFAGAAPPQPGPGRRKPARATLQGFGAPDLPLGPPQPARPQPPGPRPARPQPARPQPARPPRPAAPGGPGPAQPPGAADLRASVLNTPQRPAPAGLPRGPRPPQGPPPGPSSPALKPEPTLGEGPIDDDNKPTLAALRDDLPVFGEDDDDVDAATRVSEESEKLASSMDDKGPAEVVVSPLQRTPSGLTPEPQLGKASSREMDENADTILQDDFEEAGGSLPQEVVVYPKGGPAGPVDPTAPTIAPGELNIADLKISPPRPASASEPEPSLPEFADDGPTVVDPRARGAVPPLEEGLLPPTMPPASAAAAGLDDDAPTAAVDVPPGVRSSFISEETKPVMGPPGEPARPPGFSPESSSQVTSPFEPPRRLEPSRPSPAGPVPVGSGPVGPLPVAPGPGSMDFQPGGDSGLEQLPGDVEEASVPSLQQPAGGSGRDASPFDAGPDSSDPFGVPHSEVDVLPGAVPSSRKKWLLIGLLSLAALLIGTSAALVYVFVIAKDHGQGAPAARTGQPAGQLGAVALVSADPFSGTVLLNGEEKGEVKGALRYSLKQVPPGEHRIEVRSGKLRFNQLVQVKAGKEQEVKIKLKGQPEPKPKPKTEALKTKEPKTEEPKPKPEQPKTEEPKPQAKARPSWGVQAKPRPVAKPKPVAKPVVKPKPRPVIKHRPKPRPVIKHRPKPRPKPRPRGKPGYLLVSSKPWAKIYVDGRPTGRNTPTPPSQPLVLGAGPHRITLEVGDRRFTYPVVISSGETSKLIKTLPVNR